MLEVEDVPGDLRGHVGVAVAVAADPGAEGQRADALGQLQADPGELLLELLQDLRDGVAVELVQVVDGVAGLVGGLGAGDAQLVGLPQQVDHLGEAPVGLAAGGGGAGRVGVREAGGEFLAVDAVEQLADPAELVEDAAAGRLGRVRGEDRPDGEVGQGVPEVLGVGLGQLVGGLREQRALAGAAGGELAAAVHLLGDVGEVEVGGEGTDQLGGGVQVDVGEQFGGGLAVGAAEQSDLFDQAEQLGAFLADQGFAEQVAEATDVRAQRGVVGVDGGRAVRRAGDRSGHGWLPRGGGVFGNGSSSQGRPVCGGCDACGPRCPTRPA